MPQEHHTASIKISAPLVEQIRSQKGDSLTARSLQTEQKKHCSVQCQTQQEVTSVEAMADLPAEMRRNALTYKERGCSVWLTALQIE